MEAHVVVHEVVREVAHEVVRVEVREVDQEDLVDVVQDVDGVDLAGKMLDSHEVLVHLEVLGVVLEVVLHVREVGRLDLVADSTPVVVEHL